LRQSSHALSFRDVLRGFKREVRQSFLGIVNL
jgi:hypothetical protein